MKRISIVLLPIIFMFSCAPVYRPTTVNTPMLSEAGEAKVSVFTGIHGNDVQASVAVTDQIAFLGSFNYIDRVDDSTDNYTKHQMFEFAPGYYSRFGENGIIELYAGYGNGKAKYFSEWWFIDDNSSFVKADYHKFFIQPTIGFKRKHFEIGFSNRLTMVRYYNLRTETTGHRLRHSSLKATFWEPAVSIGAGTEVVKFQGQMGLSFPMSKYDNDFQSDPFMFSVGVSFNLGRLILNSKKE